MTKFSIFKNIYTISGLQLIGIAAMSLCVLFSIDQSLFLTNAKTKPQLLYAPPEEIKYFSLGYTDLIADIFWLRVLQDIDLCEQKLAPTEEPRVGLGRKHNCNDGWVYHILNTLMASAPRWRLPAAVGPLMLSVVVDDINGASKLFKIAVKNHPTDWPILFRAGYHFLYETNDHLLAAKYFDEAGKYGAPQWVHSLAAKLYSENGRYRIAIIVLKEALLNTPPGPSRAAILSRLKQVEEKIKKLKN